MLKKLILLALFFLPVVAVFSQEKPVGKFLKDKIKVGEPVRYTLSYKHPIGEDIIFPDSTYHYTPFEFIEKQYFKTVSDSVNSYDSAVYTLSTFELDSVQHLAIPVLLIENEDTTKLFALPDSIILIPSLTVLPDSIKLMETSSYVKVDKAFNYSYFFLAISFFLLLIILFILIFGKRILKSLKIRRLRKKYFKFLVSFKEINNRVKPEDFEEPLLELYSLWKKYLQQITDKPFTTYSSKEVNRVLQNNSLKESLTEIDRGIYAHRFPDNMSKHSKALLDTAQNFYNNKLLEVKNGSKK